ncbi:unnamed protein product [Nezara viridula]|uniref:Uncharacterized protein n=1 Tax=Nezara viridula TaxID=85310 RepID=A0A9P0H344_NEZVI|nr:unnamed protein product [Nezara viridula]
MVNMREPLQAEGDIEVPTDDHWFESDEETTDEESCIGEPLPAGGDVGIPTDDDTLISDDEMIEEEHWTIRELELPSSFLTSDDEVVSEMRTLISTLERKHLPINELSSPTNGPHDPEEKITVEDPIFYMDKETRDRFIELRERYKKQLNLDDDMKL